MTTRPLRLALELDFEGERVSGRLADERGNAWAFSSWLDLLRLIEQARIAPSSHGLKATDIAA